MKSKYIKKIDIGKVEGDVVISQDQKGGITSHSIDNNKRKRKRNWTITSIILFLAAIVTILTWFGINPYSNNDTTTQFKSNQPKVISEADREENSSIPKSKLNRENKMIGKKDEKPIHIDKVEGDVVISQNQNGGQVAHTINNYGPPKRIISEDIKDKMLSELRKYSGQKIGFASTQGDMEAAEYKVKLINIFKEAGWNVVDMRTFMFFGEQKGFVVTIPFKAEETGIPQVVSHVLSFTGNPIIGNRGDMANECGIYVQVWHNPN